jgi:hypothetical protein
MGGLFKKTSDAEPEMLDRMDRFPEIGEAARFVDKAIRSQLICAYDVPLGVRGCKDHHWDRLKAGLRFEVGQYHAPILARKIEIKDHEVGAFSISVAASTANERNRLFTVRYRVDVAFVVAG